MKNITTSTKKDEKVVYMHNQLKKTYQKIINLMKLKKDDKILDIGCGDGYFIHKFLVI